MLCYVKDVSLKIYDPKKNIKFCLIKNTYNRNTKGNLIEMKRFINISTTIENILGLYRNYSFITKPRRVIFMVQAMLEQIFYILAFPFYIKYMSVGLNGDSLYFCLALFNSTLMFLLCLYNSKLFQNLLYYLNINNYLLRKDIIYQKKMEKSCINVLVILIMTTFASLLSAFVPWLIDLKIDLTLYFITVRVITLTYWNARYFTEYFIIYGLLDIISEQSNSIIRNLKMKTFKFGMIHLDEESEIDLKPFGKMIDDCQIMYSNIKKSIELINRIFGLQVSVI